MWKNHGCMKWNPDNFLDVTQVSQDKKNGMSIPLPYSSIATAVLLPLLIENIFIANI